MKNKKIDNWPVVGFITSSTALFISTVSFGLEYLITGATEYAYFSGLSWTFLGFDFIYLISLIGMIIATFKTIKEK